MADWRAARDEDRLPWLEPFGESERAQRKRKPASGAALVALLIAFFGVGLAVAFSTRLSLRQVASRGARGERPQTALQGRPRSKCRSLLRSPCRKSSWSRRRWLPKRLLPSRLSRQAVEPAGPNGPTAPRPRPKRNSVTSESQSCGRSSISRSVRRPPRRPSLSVGRRRRRWRSGQGQMVQLGSYSTQSEADQGVAIDCLALSLPSQQAACCRPYATGRRLSILPVAAWHRDPGPIARHLPASASPRPKLHRDLLIRGS